MNRKINYLLLIIIFFLSLHIFAQEQQGSITILSDIIQEALEKNPQIKAVYQEWQAALEEIPQAKALPDPMISYAHFGQSIETRLGPQRNKISISQKIPFFGKLTLKEKIALKNADILEENYNAVKADVVFKVKDAYYSLYWIDQAINISLQEKEVLHRFARIAQKKYETGQGTQQDVLKAHVEISKLSEKILTLNQGRRAVANEINILLNRQVEYPVRKIEVFKIPTMEIEINRLYQIAERERPEIKKISHFIEMNEVGLKLAKKNYRPDFTFMFDYIDIGSGRTLNLEDGRNAWMLSVGINIPIWRKKLYAAEAEQALKIKAAEQQYKDIENMTLSKINELFFEINTAKERIELYEHSLIPQAEQSLKASEVGYLTGKVDFLNLLDSERMILQLKTGYYKSVSDYGKSLAHLERVVGKELVEYQ